MNLLYGLIGYPLSHSWSAGYFAEKFKTESIDNTKYQSFPIKDISELNDLIETHENIRGLNVTIPYKEKVIPLLDSISTSAQEIGAVNTIKIIRTNSGIIKKGFNTDVNGIMKSLEYYQVQVPDKVLILGTGGAAKAVAWVLQHHSCSLFFATRTPRSANHISYTELKNQGLYSYKLIINTTPLGMHPDVSALPEIPYDTLNSKHILFDLIYNPEKTAFLKRGETAGCKIINGLYMLQQQAEKSWEIWNNELL